MIYDQLLKFSSLFFIFANKYEDKLKKPIGKKFSDDENFLIRNNIIPIQIGDNETSFIDQGSFSKVYRVIYKGKSAVAKITDWKDDFRKMIVFSSLKDKIPEKYQKHIPIIFDTINENNKFVIVMEELQKTNAHIKDFIEKSCDSIIKNNILDLNKNLKYIIDTFINLLKISDANQLKKYKSCINEIVTHLQKDNLSILDIEKNYDYFNDEFYRIKEGLFIFLTLVCEFERSDASIVSNQYLRLLNQTFDFIKFPEEHYRNQGHFAEAPETQSLLECLKYLKDKFGIKWGDLRSPNIMERPGTRDLVISDPGVFDGL